MRPPDRPTAVSCEKSGATVSITLDTYSHAITALQEEATYCCIDFGYRSPACAWLQVSPKGQWFIVAELVPHDLTTGEFAQATLTQSAPSASRSRSARPSSTPLADR